MRFASLVWLALAVGCTPGAQGNEESVCTVLCRCQAGGLPSQQDACIEACVDNVSFDQLRDQCVSCIFVHADSCSRLFDTCDVTCGGGGPDPEPTFPDAGFIADAF